MQTLMDARYRAKTLQESLNNSGLRRDWVASNAGISPSLLTRIANGERTASQEVAGRIAAILGVNFFDLWTSTQQDDMATLESRIA